MAAGGSDASLPGSSSGSGSGSGPGPGPDDEGACDDAGGFGDLDGLEGTLAAAKEREELLAGFAPGGVWDKHPPGPELAAALARAAGPGWRCALATGEERVGLLRAMAALQSWAAAGLLGMVRALIRDDDEPYLGRPRHGDLPDQWDDSLTHEIALALGVSVPSAEKSMRAAWELGARLPGIAALLEDGTLDSPRARLIAEVFEQLSDCDAARAEELLLPELTAPPRKTYGQIERLASAIAATVDPGLAERRRKAAEKQLARVRMFRERSGTAGLSGRDLPTDQTLAADASLTARALQYKESGAFPGERMDRLRATAYLDLLNDITAEERIAHGQLSPAPPRCRPDADPDADPDNGPGSPESGGPRPGGSDCPCRECDGSCAPPDDGDLPDDEPDDDGGPGGSKPPRGGPGDSGGDGKRGDGPRAGGPGAGSDESPEAGPMPPRSPFLGPAGGPKPTLTDLIFPLATLLGQAERPGEGHGLGTLDPDLCRALAATAGLSPHTTICVTVTNHDGIAIGHGCAKSGRLARPPGGPPSPLVALPARINLTITATRLAGLLARPGPPGRPASANSRAAAGWAFAPRGTPSTRGAPDAWSGAQASGTAVARTPQGPPGDPDWCRPWTLTLPSGLEYSVSLEPVPTFDCDHRNESHAYKPNDTLRHLVQVRDYTCTFPSCARHARDSDFEHAVPYDQGGRTCACNAGARSRRCHRVKQARGWDVTQPQPGWHQWTTPRGRTYTQGPKRYPV